MYEYLVIESDLYRQKDGVYYLVGYKENVGDIVATYSIKLDRVMIRNASKFMPTQGQLIGFVAEARARNEEGELDE